MKLLAVILLLGVYLPHWTIAFPNSPRSYVWSMDNRTLERVITVVNYHPTHVDLSEMEIEFFEENAFDDLINLQKLDLSNNKIKILPPHIFSKLNGLEELLLANNKIEDIKGLFVGLKNLKRLDLSNNNISELRRGDLFGLTRSTDILIEGNDLKKLSSCVFQDPSAPVQNFESEYQAYYEFSDEYELSDLALPDSFQVKICKSDNETLKSVERWYKHEELGDCVEANIDRMERILYLNHLDVSRIEPDWYKLPGYTISEIDFSFNNIIEITPELLNDLPPGVISVDFSFNKLGIIRKNVIKNKYMKELILDSNFIESIDPNAFENTALITLAAGGNNLESAAFIQSLPNIEEFYVPFNFIPEVFNDTFRGLKKLRILDLSDNFLESMKSGTFKDQRQLLELRLASNSIPELPYGLFEGLEQLKLLNLRHNKLEKISQNTFSELRNVKDLEIYLNDNEIKVIEEGSFSNLDLISLDLSLNRINNVSIAKGAFRKCKVQKLALGKNNIEKINSEVFSGILGSYELDLYDNQIKSIEKGDVEHLSNVRELTLDSNPIERFENGVLYGLSKDKDVKISLKDVPLEVIQGGLFENL